MSIDFIRPEVDELRPRISVIGVGGAGGNAIANMMRRRRPGRRFRRRQHRRAGAQRTRPPTAGIQLGLKITQGLGAGSRPEIGRAAAEETIDEIMAGAGRRAHVLHRRRHGRRHRHRRRAGHRQGSPRQGHPDRRRGAPSRSRSKARAARARPMPGIAELQQHVDTLIVIPNQNLFRLANSETTFKEAFEMADEVLQQGVRGITDLMVMPGLINLDFADVRSVMSEMGKAMMGTGEADGDNRAIEAAEKAISNPLLDGVSMKGAKGVIISITGGEDMRLMEVDEAASHIKELVDPDANIIWGSAFNNDLGGKIRVSVVATGIEAEVGGAAAAGARYSASRPGTAPAPAISRGCGKSHTAIEDEAHRRRPAEDGDDELLLGADDILTSPVGAPPIAPPEDEDEIEAADRWRRRHLVRAHVEHRARRSQGADATRTMPSRASGATRSTSRASSTGKTTSKSSTRLHEEGRSRGAALFRSI